MNEVKTYSAKAFVSCSLRSEDEDFVNHVCSILEERNIEPYGTVGKFSASPENPTALMNKNIPDADLLVVCATPRYAQIDMTTGKKSNGMSEMIHVETGMAMAHNKPVIVFVKEGTNVGSFLPNITQYITLNETSSGYEQNDDLIDSLFNSVKSMVQKFKSSETAKKGAMLIVFCLAIYGSYHLFKRVFVKSK